MNPTETKITIAGVFRCCIHSMMEKMQARDNDVFNGDSESCKHCENEFTLIDGIWKPNNTD